MLIDDCPHDFATLTNRIIPEHFRRLRAQIERPLLMADFAVEGSGVRSLLLKHGHTSDFSGCYVLIDQGRPIYVGISRTVFARLRQHVMGKSHFDASLAYRIATQRAPHSMTRGQAMQDQGFQTAFANAKSYLRSLQVATIDISNPVELYVFEVCAAMELQTSTWNTFRTH